MKQSEVLKHIKFKKFGKGTPFTDEDSFRELEDLESVSKE